MTEIKNEIPGITPASIKMDLVRFKNDILKDFRSIQFSLDDKYLKADQVLKERITQFEVKLNALNKKISELSNLVFTENNIKEKVESLFKFKEEIQEDMFKRRAKFYDFESKIDKDIDRINNILTTSVIYPSLIGKSAKYKTFHDFLDFVNKELNKLIIFKEKNFLDLAPYKRKIDQTIDTFKLIMKNYSSRDYIDNLFNLTEEKIKSVHKIYDERLEETRIENSQFALILRKKSDEINKQLENFQKMINKKLENPNNFDNNYNEINHIKNRLNKHSEIIKELLAYHPSVKKNHIHEIEKKSSKVYSGVKQYIKGNINANELSAMKRFNFEKSKTKIFNKESTSPNISSFPSPENINDLRRKRNSHILNNTDLLFINSHTNHINEYNTNFDIKKNYKTHKSFNKQNEEILLDKNFIEEDIKNKINNYDKNENIEFKKNIFIKRKPFNSNIDSYESSKFSNEGIRDLKKHSSKLINNNYKIIDNEIQINNKTKDINIINENSKEKLDININSIGLNDNSKKQRDNNNQFVIKEEDENTGSDNSCKNLNFFAKAKNSKKKEISHKKIVEEKIHSKKINKEEENNEKNAIINNDEKNINLNFREYNKEKMDSFNKILNSNISENHNSIRILSLKRKIKTNNDDNCKEKLDIFEENNKNEKNSLVKNKIIKYKEISGKSTTKDMIQKSPQLESKSIDMKKIKDEKLDNPNKIHIKNNSSYPKQTKNIINNYNLKKNNINKYPLTPKSSSFENNINYKRNKIPINSDNKPNYNSISINNVSKTYTNFPKIIKDLSGKKLFNNNNYIKSKDMDIFTKTLSDKKLFNQDSLKLSTYIKKPKKILLTNPDNIPSNSTMRKIFKNII